MWKVKMGRRDLCTYDPPETSLLLGLFCLPLGMMPNEWLYCPLGRGWRVAATAHFCPFGHEALQKPSQRPMQGQRKIRSCLQAR